MRTATRLLSRSGHLEVSGGLHWLRACSRRDAHRRVRHRKASLDGALGLLALAAPVTAEVVWEGDGPSRAHLEDSGVSVERGLSPFDTTFAAAHDLGHLFDHQALDDDLRAMFAAAVPTCDQWWGRYSSSAGEAFAATFAVESCQRPWWGTNWVPCNWEPAHTAQVLSTARAVIEASCRRRLPVITHRWDNVTNASQLRKGLDSHI